MASTVRLSYQRLRNEGGLFEEEDLKLIRERARIRASRRVHIRRRFKIRIPRLLKRKARLIMLAWTKILKRLKDSQSHFGDLFAGNYLFIQVTPTTTKAALPPPPPPRCYSLPLPG